MLLTSALPFLAALASLTFAMPHPDPVQQGLTIIQALPDDPTRTAIAPPSPTPPAEDIIQQQLPVIVERDLHAAAAVEGHELEKRAPGPSGRVLRPTGGSVFVSNGGIIPFEYQKVELDWTKTRNVNVFLIRRSLNYNHTLATDLDGPPTGGNIKTWFRIPRDIPSFGSDYQLQVVESQYDPYDSSAGYSVQPFVAAAPYITITFAG